MSDFVFQDTEYTSTVVNHRPLFKRVVNPILRALQPWTNRPYVIYTQTRVTHPAELPIIVGYGFGPIEYR